MRANWQYMLIALGISLILWFMVSGQSQVETMLDVRVEFWGMPRDMVIRDGMVQRVSVRVSGTRGTLRTINPSDLVYPLDLSGMEAGSNIIPLSPGRVFGTRGAQVTEISPSRLTLTIDTLERTNLPLDARLEGTAPSWLTVDSVEFSPASIPVNGPASILETMQQVSMGVAIPQNLRPGENRLTVPLALPDEVSSTVAQIQAKLSVSARMREVTVQRDVHVRTAQDATVQTDSGQTSGHVSLRLNIPAYRDSEQVREYLQQVVAYVEVPTGASGPLPLAVQLELPEYCEFISAVPSTVTVQTGP